MQSPHGESKIWEIRPTVDSARRQQVRTDRDRPPLRLAHVVSHPIQYFAPLYREIAATGAVDLTVYFMSDATLRDHHDPGFDRPVKWDIDLVGGYRHRIVRSASGRPVRAGLRQLPQVDLLWELSTGRYDVIWLHGYNNSTLALACLAGRAVRRPVLIREEQTLLEPRSWIKAVVKETGLRLLLRQVGGLYIGEESRRYLQHFGVPEQRLFPALYCVDNERLQEQARVLAGDRQAIRASLGVTDDNPVVLFCGKLVDRKGPMELLRAFGEVRARRPCWLLFAGEGPLRADIEEAVRTGFIENVHILGFLNQTELPRAYCAADMFVLPSKYNETWGLVVNEAMIFGLPVITSDHVGCSLDLVHHGRNGFVTRAGFVSDLSYAIETLVSDEALRAGFGANSRSLIAPFTVSASAAAIVQAAGIVAAAGTA
jgi:glycosyltransferase involved in cell wall biosynthesis